MKKFIQLFVVVFFLTSILAASLVKAETSTNRNIKVLVLIISSDGNPVYGVLEKLWKSYMHLDRNHVEAYFLKADERLLIPFDVQDDVLWTQTPESYIPGILNKTILSFEAMLPRIKNEFDYVLRTNLSSFYVFPRLLKFLQTLPKDHCYCALIGENVPGVRYGAGSGFILSPDLVELIVQKKEKLLNSAWCFDDVVIGKFFQNERVGIIPAPRMDYYSLNDWVNKQGIFLAAVPHYPEHVVSEKIPEDVFHFRVKAGIDEHRFSDDIPIYIDLVKMFYPEACLPSDVVIPSLK